MAGKYRAASHNQKRKQVIVNHFMLWVAVFQIIAGLHGALLASQPRMGIIFILVGVSNAVASTIRA